MNNMKKLIIANVATLTVLIGGGFGGYYFYNQADSYLKTDNAKVSGDQIVITSPISGKLSNWNGKVGTVVGEGQKLGQVQVPAPTPDEPEKVLTTDVTAPNGGTIVLNKAANNGLVAQGTPLGYAYNFDELYITANIEESDIDDVTVGQEVDIYVDALKDTTLKGKVEEIGLTTANTFSILPSGSSDANYTKVKQVIPVKISIDEHKGSQLLPGLNVSVRIHK